MDFEILKGPPLVPAWATNLMIQRSTSHLAWALNEKFIVTLHILNGRVQSAEPPVAMLGKGYEEYLESKYGCICIPHAVQLENE